MSDPAETYFPDERPAWDFVRNEFPFPLAITCTRLLGEMERQEPIAAAWALRDAFECIIKFSASLAVADFMNAGPDPTAAGEVAQLLLKSSGLSLGDWHTLLEMALRPLGAQAKAGRLHESGRTLFVLLPVFFETQGRFRPTKLNHKIDGGQESFVPWRNHVFGHGVFSQDRNYYAEQTSVWLPTLGDFYAALRPVLAGRRLVGRTPGGDEVVWQGACDLPPVPRHEHEPWGDPLPMFLAPAPGSSLPSLPLMPFLSMQLCQSCGQPAAFFFDKNTYHRKQDRHATTFLEYSSGHPGTRKNWSETRRVADLVPPTFEWERGSYDGEEADRSQNIVFRDFDTEYLRPDYLLDAVWRITEEQPQGYIHFVGPGGMGKTYFIRGLAAEGKEQGAAVLTYHILPGARTDARTFLSELNAYARDTLRFLTQEPQMRGVNTAAEMQAEFVSYLSELKRANRIDLLIVTIDALDELSDPSDRSIGITDCLPPPAELPDGCFFVLTSREELRPKVRADITRLQAAAPEAYTTLALGSGDTANQGLLRAYLAKHLPLPLRTPETINTVLVRCGDIFLYAFHLCRALEAGVFPDVTALPDGAEFYPAYLERLRTRVGDHLYETVYLPILLLLCAAQQPVTLDQLARWGVPQNRLQFALLDLRDFLRVHRELPWLEFYFDWNSQNRYEMAHEAFSRFVHGEQRLSARYQEVNASMFHAVLESYGGNWGDVDLNDLGLDNPSALYDYRFVLYHARASGLPYGQDALYSNAGYAETCKRLGYAAYDLTRYGLSLGLLENASDAYRFLIRNSDLERYTSDLAYTLRLRGNVMNKARRFEEAISCHAEAIDIYRTIAVNGRSHSAITLAEALMDKASALQGIGDLAEALSCNLEALTIYRQLNNDDGPFLPNNQAKIAINHGNILMTNGQFQEALTFYEKALVVLNAIISPGDNWLVEDCLYKVFGGIAWVLTEQDRHQEALYYYEKCISYLPKYEDYGYGSYTGEAARALVNLGIGLCNLSRYEEALISNQEAIDIYRGLVEAGRQEYEPELNGATNNQALIVTRVHDLGTSSFRRDDAFSLWSAERSMTIIESTSQFEPGPQWPCGPVEPTEGVLADQICSAAARGYLERVYPLLAAYSGLVHARDRDGWTALHWAARYGQEQAVQILLQHGSDMNAVQEKNRETDTDDVRRLKEKDGRTPLHSAVYGGHIEIVRLLLKHGANQNLTDVHGRRPQDVTEDPMIKQLLAEDGREKQYDE